MAAAWLFVPGHRPERFDKACAAGAGVVVIDLEDAVAPADKGAAREAAWAWLRARGAEVAGPAIVLRINAANTAWFTADLAVCALPAVAGVMLPKAEEAATLHAVAAAAPQAALLPLIESAAGFAARDVLAQVPGVRRLVFGSIDFQRDLCIAGEGDELLMFRSQLVLSSRLAGLAAPVDGVSTAFDDTELLRADSRRARRLGFGAKLCIHPRQVAAVNEAFAPSAADLAWAQRVLDVAANARGAAVALDGQMVDKPVVLRAQALLQTGAGQGTSL